MSNDLILAAIYDLECFKANPNELCVEVFNVQKNLIMDEFFSIKKKTYKKLETFWENFMINLFSAWRK